MERINPADYPVVRLENVDDGYMSLYENEAVLAERFPDEDAYDFLAAIFYNDPTLWRTIGEQGIAHLKMLVQGERDEGDWLWQFALGDGRTGTLEGGCDYTGWDCQSWCRVEWGS